MTRRILPTLAVLFLATGPALAEGKNSPTPKALKGKWAREVNNVVISFEFKDEKTFECRLRPSDAADENAITTQCEFKLGKNGVMEFTITDIDKKGQENLPDKGDKFSFKVEAGKEKLTISDFKGDKVPDGAKEIVEGEYTKK